MAVKEGWGWIGFGFALGQLGDFLHFQGELQASGENGIGICGR